MNRICVYCGSRTGRTPLFQEATEEFGRELAKRDIELVYGGGGVGLMNVLAETVLESGGTAIGVIPEALEERERPPSTLTELYVVDSMHTRKQKMFDLADGFVALAGGLGTLEELFEMLTWAQLGIHEQPCGILNSEGYYDDLIAFVDHAVDTGFVSETHRRLLTVAGEPASLLDAFEEYDPPRRDEHMDIDET